MIWYVQFGCILKRFAFYVFPMTLGNYFPHSFISRKLKWVGKLLNGTHSVFIDS